MDFMKLLKSLDELLYELVSWVVFYPLTFWRALVRPQQMMRYADIELADKAEDQYQDTLRPPLFLLITILLSQALSLAIPSIYESGDSLKLYETETNLLIGRGVIFSIFPLIMAVALLRRKRQKLTRESLRPPFYSQCYVAAPFVLGFGIGMDLINVPDSQAVWPGAAMLSLVFFWYGAAQVRWFRHDLSVSVWTAIGLFVINMVLATVIALALTLAIGFSLKGSD